ncbi:MAG: hypothetical protein CMK32_12115 [Porticoccaceae bacterium]|jgi:hypothetical protein|nr:hypothetical protein [Porticoccaceae bacterium]|tara:strand:- start:44 stop:418 length:375 start_codon:yes stop_codon:yes gene_type:complete
MFNKIALSTLAVSCFAAPAIAGPYVNVEAKQKWSGENYKSATLDTHVGYENKLGDSATWYIQGGPQVRFPDDAEQVGAASGKTGLKFKVTKRLSAYGEISAATKEGMELEGLGVGTKAGLKYKF